MTPNGEAHLAWMKQRAMEYVDLKQPVLAVASMASDTMKHPETKTPAHFERIKTGEQLLEADATDTDAIRAWIEQF